MKGRDGTGGGEMRQRGGGRGDTRDKKKSLDVNILLLETEYCTRELV